jgi:hypothetical protein
MIFFFMNIASCVFASRQRGDWLATTTGTARCLNPASRFYGVVLALAAHRTVSLVKPDARIRRAALSVGFTSRYCAKFIPGNRRITVRPHRILAEDRDGRL